MISVATLPDYKRVDEAIKIAEECFPGQRHFEDLSKLLSNSKSNEIFIVDHVLENNLLGFLLIKFVKVHFWGELFNAATIGFVSVKKDRQKKGLGTSLLAASENFAATRSCYILYLQGIKNYYSKFGFIPQFGKSKMTFQTEYEFSDENVSLRKAEITDLAALANLYNENSSYTNCAAARTIEDWNWLLLSASNTMFFDNPTLALLDNIPIGYFCWDRFEPSRIREACSQNTVKGSSSLVKGLINYAKQKGLKNLDIMCPQDSSLYQILKSEYDCDYTQHFRVNAMQLIKICDANLASDLMNKRLTKSGFQHLKTKPVKLSSDRYSFNLEIFKNKIHIGTVEHRHVGRILSGELEFDALSVNEKDDCFFMPSDCNSQPKLRPFVYQGDNL